MPFVADIETRDESRGPIWGPFAVVRDNVELLLVLNLGWSLQLLPGVLALAFPQLPLWLRLTMGIYSATALIPATGVLYALTLAATRGEPLSMELAIQSWRDLALPRFRTLAPLYGVFGVLIWLAIVVGPAMPVMTTLATLACLLWYLCATFWGPMLAVHPDAAVASVVRDSLLLVWRYPAETFVTALVAAVALVVGMVSIGGLMLIVPVVIALLHTQRYLDLVAREAAAKLGE
jgi:uncharacterized membrane protein YesL